MSTLPFLTPALKPGRRECARCAGTGRFRDRLNPSLHTCPDCDGHGVIVYVQVESEDENIFAFAGPELLESGTDPDLLARQVCAAFEGDDVVLVRERRGQPLRVVGLVRAGVKGEPVVTWL